MNHIYKFYLRIYLFNYLFWIFILWPRSLYYYTSSIVKFICWKTAMQDVLQMKQPILNALLDSFQPDQ